MSKQPPKPEPTNTNGQNFQKFAAQLVSPSEVFEPRAARNRVNIPESLELLGSLASLTRSSLFQTISPSGPLAASGPTNASLSNSGSGSGTNSGSGLNSGPGAKSENGATANSVQYETSRKEYRQALEDQRISEALVKLHAHRQTHLENTQRARLSNARANTQSGHRSGAIIHQNQSGQNQQQTQKESRSGFQHASLPEVSVSAKPSPMRKSPGAYQTILRPFNPLNK
jgi:hypothetical protein